MCVCVCVCVSVCVCLCVLACLQGYGGIVCVIASLLVCMCAYMHAHICAYSASNYWHISIHKVITRIRTIISAKVDKTTCCVLGEGSDKYLDSESNLKLEHKISKMAFCIWGNLSKNPRCFNYV